MFNDIMSWYEDEYLKYLLKGYDILKGCFQTSLALSYIDK